MQKIKLIRIWYSIIIIILIALLYEHTAKLQLSNIIFWLRLLFLAVALLLTFYVVNDVFRPEKAAKRIEKIIKEVPVSSMAMLGGTIFIVTNNPARARRILSRHCKNVITTKIAEKGAQAP